MGVCGQVFIFRRCHIPRFMGIIGLCRNSKPSLKNILSIQDEHPYRPERRNASLSLLHYPNNVV